MKVTSLAIFEFFQVKLVAGFFSLIEKLDMRMQSRRKCLNIKVVLITLDECKTQARPDSSKECHTLSKKKIESHSRRTKEASSLAQRRERERDKKKHRTTRLAICGN